MSKPEFVYTTYIKATPERVWQGLTEPAFTMRYWSCGLETDWKAGSAMAWKHEDGYAIVDPEQVVLAADPFTRLSYTWHTFTPEWAAANGIPAALAAKIANEPRSKVTFDLEPAGESTKLTVTHDGFTPDSTMLGMVSQGWPAVVAALKTLLETGEDLRMR